VTNYKVQAFDDSVIFVHDVGRCLEQLDPGLRHLVRRVALEGHTHQETAALLGIGLRTVIRRYYEALDKLTRVLLDRGILQPMMAGLEED
jgi:DNA-directed RNA polymerase specialized sigma24 family protein